MFHYFNLIRTGSNKSDIEIKYNNIRITGLERSIDTYIGSYSLLNHNHWVYGPCDYETEAIGFKDIIDKNIFSQSACIKQYYNSTIKKFLIQKKKDLNGLF